MAISMYAASAPTFVQFLTSLLANLDKTNAHAAAKKIDPAIYLRTRLYPDMLPLATQVSLANRQAINACARLAGVVRVRRRRPGEFHAVGDDAAGRARAAEILGLADGLPVDRVDGGQAHPAVVPR